MDVSKHQPVVSTFVGLEGLEGRILMAYNWGYWPTYLGMDKVFANYPWLDGGGNNVAIIDKGIDYYHPNLGGNKSAGIKSPRIVNVWDYRDNDNDPFPSESEQTDPTTAHGTGVASILVAKPYDNGGKHYQGILQNTSLYNLRTNRFDSQTTIRQAFQWILANHTKYNITAVNLTDFIGTSSKTALYASEVKQLHDAGVFIITPCANDWNNPEKPKQPIGLPALDPNVFGTGGILQDGTMNPKTQRGYGLDILAPSENVNLNYYTPSTGEELTFNGGEGNSWGTPHVLGTAVMIQQIDPTIKPDEIMQILKDSGSPVSDPDHTGNYVRLNMYGAIQLAYARRDDANDQGAGGNDDLAHATRINVSGTDNSGSISDQKLLIGDSDFYAVTLTMRKYHTFKIGYVNSDFPDAQLMDADGTILSSIGRSGLTIRLSAGTYYIKVSNAASLHNTYSVAVNADAPGPEPVTTPGSAGTFNQIAYDSNNNLNFVWFDSIAKKLKYSKRSGSTFSATQIIDNNVDTGYFPSMALDSTSKPGVAYYDSVNGDLKYAHYNGSSWDVQVVDSAFTTGYYPSLQFAGNNPAIAYYSKSGGDLKFAAYNGSSWALSSIDTKGDVGRYPSLALNPATGRWAVAYENTSNGVFKYAAQGKTSWSIVNVDDTAIGGGFISLAFDHSNLPAFSYYDAANSDLKFARYSGTRWVASTLASKNSQGLYTSLFFDPGNSYYPVIYYFNKSTNAVNTARNSGKVWDFEVAATGGGRHTQVTLNNQDFESFTYLDDSTGDIKLV